MRPRTPAADRPGDGGRRASRAAGTATSCRAGTVVAVAVALSLAGSPAPARAQWAPLHPGKHHAPPPASPPPESPPPESPPPEPAPATAQGGERARTLVVPSLVAGWWGLGRSEGAGFDGTLAFGLRLQAEPLPWLPVEVLALYGSRGAGTPMVSTHSSYVSVVALAGWQFVHGHGVYGVEAGIAGTFEDASHQVSDGTPQTLNASRVAIGPAWTLDMRLRLGPVEGRVDLGSVWRGGQADLLVLAGVGLRFPFGAGE